MFNLTLRDHLQLTFTEIIKRHNAHAAKAQSRARWCRRLRGSEAVLVGGAAIAATGAAFGHGQLLAIAAASMAGVALIVLLVNLTFDFEASARAHAASGAHLWGLRERYRSLLSDLHDGVLSVAEARLRRDRLIEELRAVYDITSVIALEVDPAPPATPADEGVAPQPPAYRSA
jgi:SMODS and SLOG-associating 2TM effector domain family 4